MLSIKKHRMQHRQIDGKFLRVFATTLLWKHIRGSRLIAEPDGNKAKNWIIRSQAPKLAMIEHGEGSTTKRRWFINEGLINRIWNKI